MIRPPQLAGDHELVLVDEGPGASQSWAPGPIVFSLIVPVWWERECRHTPPRMREASGGVSLRGGSVFM
jgi:hypothetical protein